MTARDVLLLRCAQTDAEDDALVIGVRELAYHAAPLAQCMVHRALQVPDVYAYLGLAGMGDLNWEDASQLERLAAALPAFAGAAITVERLEAKLDIPGASSGRAAPFHYAVETDVAPGWQDELTHWYEKEHIPGLAAVPGCVRARRFVSQGPGPSSFSCYDLVRPGVLQSPAWLAVRHTPWSDRVRPQFRNTKRTMFRTLALSAFRRAR